MSKLPQFICKCAIVCKIMSKILSQSNIYLRTRMTQSLLLKILKYMSKQKYAKYIQSKGAYECGLCNWK